MSNKEILNRWTKLSLRKKYMPICLITVSEDGFPHVFTQQDKETLKKIYQHLMDTSGDALEETSFENQEN